MGIHEARTAKGQVDLCIFNNNDTYNVFPIIIRVTNTVCIQKLQANK